MHTVRGDAEGAVMEGWEAPTGTSPTRPSLQLLERAISPSTWRDGPCAEQVPEATCEQVGESVASLAGFRAV